MGELFIAEPVCDITGKFVSGEFTLETVSCQHCQAVIQIRIQGLNRNYSSEHTCSKCHGPICRYCAKLADKNGCDPFKAKLDRWFTEAARLKNRR